MDVSTQYFPLIIADFDASADALQRFRTEGLAAVDAAARLLIDRLAAGNQVLIFGNGGSAAQAQHMSAELVNRFLSNHRRPLPAIALTTDSSILTSIANDRDYNRIFAIQIEALGRKGDVALGISTSGNSENVNLALRTARDLGLVTIALSGRDGGAMKDLVDAEVRVRWPHTPQIQEIQDIIIHALCHAVDRHFEKLPEVAP